MNREGPSDVLCKTKYFFKYIYIYMCTMTIHVELLNPSLLRGVSALLAEGFRGGLGPMAAVSSSGSGSDGPRRQRAAGSKAWVPAAGERG